jgi:hypothetical protein
LADIASSNEYTYGETHCAILPASGTGLKQDGANILVCGTVPIQKLQQGGNEEVHSMCILVNEEGQAPEEVHNAANGMKHGLPRCWRWWRWVRWIEGRT